MCGRSGLCSTHESWVKFDSTLTQMSRVRVESAVKIKDMSRVRVESCWSSFESELSQLDTAWVKVESMILQDLAVICNFTETEPTYSYIRPHSPPPPGQQLFPKLGKMWWVVGQMWLNYDSNELSQSWVRLVNLGFELSRSWVRLANLGFELSRSWVTWIVIWVRVESARKIWVEHNPGGDNLSSKELCMGKHSLMRWITKSIVTIKIRISASVLIWIPFILIWSPLILIWSPFILIWSPLILIWCPVILIWSPLILIWTPFILIWG